MSRNELDGFRRFYDSVYYRDAVPYEQVPRHLRRLARRLQVRDGERVLDVGCGSGEWLFACREQGAIVSGVDLSEKAVSVCKSVMPDGSFYAGVAEVLTFENDRFDLVSCLGSLEHFSDQPRALREMVRVAKPNARLLLCVPNSRFLTRRLGLYQGTFQVAVREEVHSLEEWAGMFRDSGLDVHDRWRDLHVLAWSWIRSRGWRSVPLRTLQALALAVWPIAWQYQVYHLCHVR